MLKKIIFAIIALLIVSPSLILADNNSTIAYLQNQNQNTWITQALAAAEVSNPDISYLDSQTTDLMTAVKNLMTLAAVNSQDAQAVSELVTTINGNRLNGQLGAEELLNDDFWGLMALAAVNEDNLDSIKSFILDHQNDDGGWSWSYNGDSDTNDTAAAVMALLDVGLTSSSSEIVSALNYLQSAQNDDGGFAYDVAGESDGASTAWVIAALNKAGVQASSWQKGDNNPVSFLESLGQDDGSFLWLTSDENGSAMVTAYALVALNNKSYPVNYIDLQEEEEEEPVTTGHSLRIEGPENTICLANSLEASTVLELLEVGAEACDFEYTTQDSSYGTYVSSIAGINAEGMDGWQYFVDWQAGTVAVTDYQFSGAEEVLWAYGGWPFYPSKVEVNNTELEVGGNLVATATYYNGADWLTMPAVDLKIGSSNYTTNDLGQVELTMNSEGVFQVFVEQTEQQARSNKEYVQVGNGVSQTVDLTVNIEGEDGTGSPEDVIAFSVSQSSIDFGSLKPGQSSENMLSLTNTGNVGIYIEASILGDNVFTDLTKLNQMNWPEFNLNLPVANSNAVNVNLSIPEDFTQGGQQDGQLIFWAIND